MSELITRIEAAIAKKGLTFNRVERECGLGNGTIKRWSEQSPRLDKLALVADFLEVSLDYLVNGTLQTENTPNGESEGNLVCDGSPLSPLERDLIAMFRLLPDATKKEVFDLVHFKYTRLTGGEKESIFSTYFDESSNAKSDPADSHERRSGTA